MFWLKKFNWDEAIKRCSCSSTTNYTFKCFNRLLSADRSFNFSVHLYFPARWQIEIPSVISICNSKTTEYYRSMARKSLKNSVAHCIGWTGNWWSPEMDLDLEKGNWWLGIVTITGFGLLESSDGWEKGRILGWGGDCSEQNQGYLLLS